MLGRKHTSAEAKNPSWEATMMSSVPDRIGWV